MESLKEIGRQFLGGGSRKLELISLQKNMLKHWELVADEPYLSGQNQARIRFQRKKRDQDGDILWHFLKNRFFAIFRITTPRLNDKREVINFKKLTYRQAVATIW